MIKQFTFLLTAFVWLTAFGGFGQAAFAQQAPALTGPGQTDPGYVARKLRQVAPATTGSAGSPQHRSIEPPGHPLPDCYETLDKTTYTPLPRNDDDSYGPINLGFTFYLFGTAYQSVYLNTNGNITFAAPYSAFTASGFPISTPMIAPFWADVDTRAPATGNRGNVWYHLYSDRLVVTWDSVGYFARQTTLRNNFQLTIFANAGGLLNEDVVFAYGDMQWTTGGASGGSGGFGGTPANAGINEGGGGGRYTQIGRFNLDGNAHADNVSDSGIDYLDYKCFGFKVFSAGNQPPAVAGLPQSGAITVNQGQTVNLNPQFTGPEPGQTVTVSTSLGGLCNATAITGPGTNPVVAFAVTGSACNIGTHTVTFTATDNGSPVLSSTYTLTVVVNPALTGAVWDGDLDTDYLTAANWVGDVLPQPADSVRIPGTAPRFPALTGQATAGNFRVQAGASMAVAPGSELTLNGYLYSGGPVTGIGTIALTGSIRQAIGGPQGIAIGTLNVGPAGALQRSGLIISRVLDLTGALTTAGFPCLLTSDAQGTAMVINRGTGRLVGSATVQRYLNPGPNAGLGYRHLSAPVDDQTVNSLTSALFQPVVNSAYNSVGNSVTPFPNVFSYNQSTVTRSGRPGATDFDMGWRCPPTLGTPLADAVGYTLNMPATSAANTLATMSFTGALHNGPFASGALPRGSQTESGWHLLGNPYPAPLDWTAAFAGATGLENSVYVFKSTGQYTGAYESFVNGIGTARYIGSCQGFFVRTAAAGSPGSLNLTNAARVSTYRNPDVRRAAPGSTPIADQRPQLRLQLAGTSGSPETAYVYFERGATPGFDARYDAHKLLGGEALYLATGPSADQALSINGLPALTTTGAAVPLLMYLPRPGTFILTLADWQNLPGTFSIQLEDRLLGQWLDLRRQPAYAFQTATADACGRFVLHVGQQRNTLANNNNTLSAEAVSLWPNPASSTVNISVSLPGTASAELLKITLLNLLGQPVRTLSVPVRQGSAVITLPLDGLAPGVYVLRGQSATASFARSLVVK